MSGPVVEVGAVAHGGHCVARLDGRVVFVRHALPGEVVELRLTESAPNDRFWRADAVRVVEASPDRVESVWPEAGPGGVGGGELAHVEVGAQRRWKHAVLAEAFQRFAHREFAGEVLAAPGDETGLRYRTRVEATGDAQGRAAMHVFRSKRVVALEAMPLAFAAVESALLADRFTEGARIIVASGDDGDAHVAVDGVPWRGGRRDTRRNARRRLSHSVAVAGTTYHYSVDVTGFWQVHGAAPGVLVEAVLDGLIGATAVLDLYAGVGLFSLPLAARGARVTAVEADARAAGSARRNVHEHDSVTVIHGDVRATLRGDGGTYDAAVLDPPRAGAGRATLEALSTTGVSRVVYVACDPVALARDAATLAELGFHLSGARAWDLFPMTHHVETVAVFER